MRQCSYPPARRQMTSETRQTATSSRSIDLRHGNLRVGGSFRRYPLGRSIGGGDRRSNGGRAGVERLVLVWNLESWSLELGAWGLGSLKIEGCRSRQDR